MMSIMSGMTGGTIHNAMQMTKLNMEWQQRKNDPNMPKENEEPSFLEEMKEQAEATEKSNKLAAIDGKLKSGKDLSAEEMDYLRENAPELYKEAVKIREEKKAYKQRLRGCKTKEDVDRLNAEVNQRFMAEATAVKNNPNIPRAQKQAELDKIARRAAAINSVHMEFVASEEYATLPTEEELREEEEKEKKKIRRREIEQEEQERIRFEQKEGVPEELKEAVGTWQEKLEEAAEKTAIESRAKVEQSGKKNDKFDNRRSETDRPAAKTGEMDDEAIAALKALLDSGWVPGVSHTGLAAARGIDVGAIEAEMTGVGVSGADRSAGGVGNSTASGIGSPSAGTGLVSVGTYSAKGQMVSLDVPISTKEIKA